MKTEGHAYDYHILFQSKNLVALIPERRALNIVHKKEIIFKNLKKCIAYNFPLCSFINCYSYCAT